MGPISDRWVHCPWTQCGWVAGNDVSNPSEWHGGHVFVVVCPDWLVVVRSSHAVLLQKGCFSSNKTTILNKPNHHHRSHWEVSGCLFQSCLFMIHLSCTVVGSRSKRHQNSCRYRRCSRRSPRVRSHGSGVQTSTGIAIILFCNHHQTPHNTGRHRDNSPCLRPPQIQSLLLYLSKDAASFSPQH